MSLHHLLYVFILKKKKTVNKVKVKLVSGVYRAYLVDKDVDKIFVQVERVFYTSLRNIVFKITWCKEMVEFYKLSTAVEHFFTLEEALKKARLIVHEYYVSRWQGDY